MKRESEIALSNWKQYQPFRAREEQGPPGVAVAEARTVAKSIARELIRRFGAQKVVLFGSLARDDFSRFSDIDLAVWGIPPSQFYRAVAFASGFSRAWKVDLVDPEDCSDSLRRHITDAGIEL